MLDKYKKYKGEITRMYLFASDGASFSITTDIDDLDSISKYRQHLNNMGIVVCTIRKEPNPTLFTKLILFIEYLMFGYCTY